MIDQTVDHVTELLKLNYLLEKGDITGAEYTQRQTARAMLMYPGERNPLLKLLESPLGEMILKSAPRTNAVDQTVAYAKRGYDGGSADPATLHDMGQHSDHDGMFTPENCQAAIKALMHFGATFDQAAGLVAAREKELKLGKGF